MSTDRVGGIRAKAEAVSTIFNILSWIILLVGGIAVVGSLVSGDGGGLPALIAAMVTAVAWANISLATIIAGYIANRS